MERKAAQKDPPQGGFVLKILQFGWFCCLYYAITRSGCVRL